MGAFDKVKSGFPGMDELFKFYPDSDNVVWSVSDLEDFKFLPCLLRRRLSGTDGI